MREPLCTAGNAAVSPAGIERNRSRVFRGGGRGTPRIDPEIKVKRKMQNEKQQGKIKNNSDAWGGCSTFAFCVFTFSFER